MRNLFTIIMLCLATLVFAQQNVGFREGNVSSPVVNLDGSVTFRIVAPKAKKVEIFGDWEQGGGYLNLTKTDKKAGVWQATTQKLPSEMYMYRVSVDGVAGLDPTNPFTKRDVGTVFSMFFVDGEYGNLYQVQDVPHGQLSTTWYRSDKADAHRRLSIYTPPMYEDTKRSYPVLYLLHGSGGDETAWVELGNTVRIMGNLIAKGLIEPMIVVMPNGNFSVPAAPGETPENLNYRPVMSNLIPGNYKNGHYEMSFMEIVKYMDSHYRTIADKKGRAVAGLSMGGFHTLFITLNNPDVFNYIGLFSAGLGNHFLNEEEEAYRDYDHKLEIMRDNGYELFWIAIGKDDFLYDVNMEFKDKLDAMQIPYKYRESTRGHLWINWRQYLIEFTQMLFK